MDWEFMKQYVWEVDSISWMMNYNLIATFGHVASYCLL